ncbi:MAG: hypothetical protein J1F35_01005 [Erysipelotrichales bacterium]|nr:hypothetical protein [Erysipelotrichales bacterium]
MKNNKNIAIYIVAIVVISVISGFIYGYNKDFDISSYLATLTTKNNLYLMHTLGIILIFIGTLSLINVLTESIIFSIEGISIGFILAIFFKNYRIKGIFYALAIILVNKLIYILLISYLFIVGFKYGSKIIKNIIGINNDYVKHLHKPLIQKFALILIISIINDTIIYFFGNIFLNYLTFML